MANKLNSILVFSFIFLMSYQTLSANQIFISETKGTRGIFHIGYLDDEVDQIKQKQKNKREKEKRSYEEIEKMSLDCNNLNKAQISQATRNRVSQIYNVRESTLVFRGATWKVDLTLNSLPIPSCVATFDSTRGLVKIRGYTTHENGKKNSYRLTKLSLLVALQFGSVNSGFAAGLKESFEKESSKVLTENQIFIEEMRKEFDRHLHLTVYVDC